MTDKKTNKPVTDEYYVRPQEAWKLMKAAQSIHQMVYIYGVTGTGKTSFVADYLNRKRYVYLPLAEIGIEKAADILEEKEEQVQIVVFDDLYILETSDDKAICGELIEKFAKRKDVWVILISRAQMPKWLKTIYVQCSMRTISEEDLCLSEKEQEIYFTKWDVYPTKAATEMIRRLDNGHPLYLKIAAMRLKGVAGLEEGCDREKEELRALESSREDLWDYLEIHVYDQWSLEQQEFLEMISIVEEFDLRMAQQITKKEDAGNLILRAQETGNFIVEWRDNEKSMYKLRRPMKYSMRRRLLAKYSKEYVKELYYNAGSSYELQGNIKEALRMYEVCKSEEGISRILIDNMRKNPAAGEYFELKHYYLALSERRIRESIELMAGMSMLQSMLLNEEESEHWYQELKKYADEKSGGLKRAAEARLLYLDIALPHRGIISMTELLKHAGLLLTERKVILPEFSVTSNLPSMMNGGKDFCEWSRRDKELARKIGPIVTLVLGKYGKGLVNLALSESFFEKGEDDYEVASLAGSGRMQAESGGKTEQVFVAVGILAQLSALNNRMEDAAAMLNSFRGIAERDAPKLLPNIDAFLCRMDLYAGKIREVTLWLKEAPDEDMEFNSMERYRYMIKVRAYLATGRKEKAVLLLKKMQYYAEKSHRTYIQIESDILLAIGLYRLKRDGWQEALQRAVSLAEEYHFVRVFTKEGAAVYELLKADTADFKDEKFKKRIMAECKKIAEFYPAYLKEKQEGNILLSDKALMILRLQSEGMSVEKIAEQIGLSKAGVKYYNQESYKKLGVNNKAAAVMEARNRGLL